MRLFFAFVLVCFCSMVVNAELFKSDNPFPAQTNPEKFNNIYESEPAVIQKEVKKKKNSWWRVREDITEPETVIKKNTNFTTINEGVQNGNFYIIQQ